MIKIFFILLLFLVGCGREHNSLPLIDEQPEHSYIDVIEPTEDNVEPIIEKNTTLPQCSVPNVILDDDVFTDPDGYGTVATALQLHKQGKIKLLAINTVGEDINKRKTLGIQAMTYYYGLSDIPIGESNRTDMRVAAGTVSEYYPRLSEVYNGTYRDIGEFPVSDNVHNALELTTKILEETGCKVTYVVGGQLHNIADIISTSPRLANDAIDVILLSTGWDSYTSKHPEMNMSTLSYDVTGASKATNITFSSDIPLVVIPPPGNKFGRLGQLYTEYHTNSPMAFAYAIEWYTTGLVDGHTIGDTATLLYTIHPAHITETCFDVTDYGAIAITNDRCNQYFLSPSNNYYDIIRDEIKELMEAPV